jgi:hypothetical protein
MQSESMTRATLEALKAPAEVFRSAVAAAANEVGGRLAARRDPADGRVARAAVGLGTFGARWVDAERFSALFGESEVLDPVTLARVERAFETLSGIVRAGDELFTVARRAGRRPPGERGGGARAGRRRLRGRPRGGARPARPPFRNAGRLRQPAFPSACWNRAERQHRAAARGGGGGWGSSRSGRPRRVPRRAT